MWPRPTKPMSPSTARRGANPEPLRRSRGGIPDPVPKVRGEQDSCLDIGTPDRAQPHPVMRTLATDTSCYLVMRGFFTCLALPRRKFSCGFLQGPHATRARVAHFRSKAGTCLPRLKSNLII